MRGSAQKIRLGIFILVGSVILLLMLGFFTARKVLEKTDIYYVAFSDVSVSGLETGSPVKYLGISVGSISSIRIDPADVNRIIVRLSLKHGTPVKEDAVADIVSMGITGLKTIEIRGGTNEAGFLPQEQFIQQGSSLVEEISGRAEVIAFKVEEVVNNLLLLTHPNNVSKVPETLDKIALLAHNANISFELFNDVLAENRQDLRMSLRQTRQVSGQLEHTSVQLHEAISKFNSIMQGDTLDVVLSSLRDVSLALKESNLKLLIENLAVATAQTQVVLQKLDGSIDKSSKELEENLILLKYSFQNLEEMSRKINADPSMLIRGNRAKDIPDRKLQ
jgi:phospholipid/cholesterol/gamma-HCH transport system substrate-binding protein